MNNVIKTNWKYGKTTLYRQIHLVTGDAFHALPRTHYQAILLSTKFSLTSIFPSHIIKNSFE